MPSLSPVAFLDDQALLSALQSAFVSSEQRSPVSLQRREANRIRSTSPTEVASVVLDNGSAIEVFCKYGGYYSSDDLVPKRGVPYEAFVYSNVLKMVNLPLPRYYGAYVGGNDFTVLFIENLTGAFKISLSHQTMYAAARWIGEFHRFGEELAMTSTAEPMIQYTSQHYSNVATRAFACAQASGHDSRWLRTLCAGFEAIAIPFLVGRRTVVHGEFYPSNVQVSGGVTMPVDWESAAIGAGEVDLACLTARWRESIRVNCETEYVRARWPSGVPQDFEKTLAAATLYTHLQLSRWTLEPARLQGAAEILGIF